MIRHPRRRLRRKPRATPPAPVRARSVFFEKTVTVPATEYGWLKILLASIRFRERCQSAGHGFLEGYADAAIREALHMLEWEARSRALAARDQAPARRA